MKIQLGLVAASSTWDQIAAQEGIPCVVVDLFSQPVHEMCSLLIVNRVLTNTERETVEAYLRTGGAILGSAEQLSRVAGTTASRQKLDYIVSTTDDMFRDVHLTDLGVYGAIPREANLLRTQENTFAAFAGPMGGGFAVIFPFDVEDVLPDSRAANKSFYSSHERLPEERVSLVSKGEVRQLLHRSFEYLHHARGLPYVHLWYFPSGQRNLFAFRIDTDGASQGEVDELYAVGRNNGMKMSWYLDVKHHERWLGHFGYMVDQEIGVHCYEHETFPGYDANLKNITKAVHAMKKAGLPTNGFAAPYGIWNPELARAVDELWFEYSSEFSYAYDTYPLYPQVNGKRYVTLEVPIHPICVGNMLQVGYSDDRMKEYFLMKIEQKLSRKEPLFFYHHPTHRRWGVIEYIFETIRQRGIEDTTLGEYARWWKRRLACQVMINLDGADLHITSGTPFANPWPEGMTLRIVNAKGEEAIVPAAGRIEMKSLHWVKPATPVPPPADIRRIREFDPRAMLGELYSTLTRKFR
jgi:hypothetical protein